jgi:hypothetical protein
MKTSTGLIIAGVGVVAVGGAVALYLRNKPKQTAAATKAAALPVAQTILKSGTTPGVAPLTQINYVSKMKEPTKVVAQAQTLGISTAQVNDTVNKLVADGVPVGQAMTTVSAALSVESAWKDYGIAVNAAEAAGLDPHKDKAVIIAMATAELESAKFSGNTAEISAATAMLAAAKAGTAIINKESGTLFTSAQQATYDKAMALGNVQLTPWGNVGDQLTNIPASAKVMMGDGSYQVYAKEVEITNPDGTAYLGFVPYDPATGKMLTNLLPAGTKVVEMYTAESGAAVPVGKTLAPMTDYNSDLGVWQTYDPMTGKTVDQVWSNGKFVDAKWGWDAVNLKYGMVPITAPDTQPYAAGQTQYYNPQNPYVTPWVAPAAAIPVVIPSLDAGLPITKTPVNTIPAGASYVSAGVAYDEYGNELGYVSVNIAPAPAPLITITPAPLTLDEKAILATGQDAVITIPDAVQQTEYILNQRDVSVGNLPGGYYESGGAVYDEQGNLAWLA